MAYNAHCQCSRLPSDHITSFLAGNVQFIHLQNLSVLAQQCRTPSACWPAQLPLVCQASTRHSGTSNNSYTQQRAAPHYRQHRQQQLPSQQLMSHLGTAQPFWGYLSGNDADQWTWDDDFNEAAVAKAAAAAQQLPPTPRQVAMTRQAEAAAAQRPTVITRLPEHFNSKILSNGVLLVDKPARWSSADVVRQLKALLKVDKVGHAGPLDAHATGLLIVLLGSATRLTPKLEPLERTYTGIIRLGVSTTTYDSTGQTTEVNPWQHITDHDLQEAAAQFQGDIQQLPAMWSSTKYKNRPLRWYAERGDEVVRVSKTVHISSLQLWREQAQAAVPTFSSSGTKSQQLQGSRQILARRTATAAMQQHRSGNSSVDDAGSGGAECHAGSANEVHVRIVASKGASVRVLAHDLGKALKCGAHLTALRRESIGGFCVDNAWSLDVLLPLAKKYAKGFRHVLL